MKGTVKFYSRQRGFGFIGVENSRDIFIHANNLPDGIDIMEGDELEFDTETTPKGISAINVRVVL